MYRSLDGAAAPINAAASLSEAEPQNQPEVQNTVLSFEPDTQ